MIDLVYWPTNLLFFDIPILYYYISLRSSKIFWRYIPFSRCFFIMLICNCLWIILLPFFWNSVTLIAILLLAKSQVFSCCFLNCYFWSRFKCITGWLISMIKNFFGYIYNLSFWLCFYQRFCSYFEQRTKICNLLEIFDLLVE